MITNQYIGECLAFIVRLLSAHIESATLEEDMADRRKGDKWAFLTPFRYARHVANEPDVRAAIQEGFDKAIQNRHVMIRVAFLLV